MSVNSLFTSEVEVVQVEEVYDAEVVVQTRRRGEAVMIECSPKQRAAKPSKAAGASSGAPPATPWSRSVHNGGRHRRSIPSVSPPPTSAAKAKTGPPADPWLKNKLTSSGKSVPRTADTSVLSMDTSISADLAAAYTGFSVGDRVIASGLRKREDLNGAQGIIVGFQRTPAGGVAAKVCFSGDLGCAALKTDNLTNAESAEVNPVEEIMVAS